MESLKLLVWFLLKDRGVLAIDCLHLLLFFYSRNVYADFVHYMHLFRTYFIALCDGEDAEVMKENEQYQNKYLPKPFGGLYMTG